MTPEMRVEFAKYLNDVRDEIGVNAARRFALDSMLMVRRESLAEHLRVMPTHSCDAREVTHTITRLSAECVLLMIARG